MDAKSYLSRFIHKKNEIDILVNAKQKLVDAATNATVDPTAERVQASGDKDRLGALSSRIADKQAEIDKEIAEAWDILSDITNMLAKVDNDSASVLLRYYVQGLKHIEIAERDHMSYATERRRYDRGIEEVDRMIQNDTSICDIV